jgi:anti-sigma regulatory factor (Ser/Thr protein kinase)
VPAVHRRHYEPQPESVSAARRFVTDVLHGDGSPAPDLLDAARLVVSELASNAVLHAQTPFVVSVERSWADELCVLIAVHDHDPAEPELRAAAAEDCSGRGILLVDRLSAVWGFDREPGGKRVWCRLQEHAPAGRAMARV